MKKQYLDYAGLKRVLKRLLPPIDAKPTCYDVDGNFVKDQKIIELTKAQYDALAVKDPDTYYVITDAQSEAYHLRPDWANAVAITAMPFTAPDDGTLVLTVGNTSAMGTRIFYIDGIEVGEFRSTSSGTIATLTFPICKGQVLTSSAEVWGSYKFVPWKAQ